MMGRNYLLTIQSRYTLHARKEGGNPKGWDSPLKFIMTTDSHIKIVEYIYENVIEYVEVSQSQLQTAYNMHPSLLQTNGCKFIHTILT